jgi:hypothetical protein
VRAGRPRWPGQRAQELPGHHSRDFAYTIPLTHEDHDGDANSPADRFAIGDTHSDCSRLFDTNRAGERPAFADALAYPIGHRASDHTDAVHYAIAYTEPTASPGGSMSPRPTRTPRPPFGPDANCDGVVTLEDALAALRNIAGTSGQEGCEAPGCSDFALIRDIIGVLRFVAGVESSVESACPAPG